MGDEKTTDYSESVSKDATTLLDALSKLDKLEQSLKDKDVALENALKEKTEKDNALKAALKEKDDFQKKHDEMNKEFEAVKKRLRELCEGVGKSSGDNEKAHPSKKRKTL